MTKDLTLLQPEDFVTMYHESFTKKLAIEKGEELAKQVLANDSLVEPIRVLETVIRLNTVFEACEKKLRGGITLTAPDSWNGMKFTPKNGSRKLTYSEDPIYADLERKLKQREELLKTAFAQTEPFYDAEGIEVPKVGYTFTKDSITVSF